MILITVYRTGKSIIILELMALICVISILLMPSIGYTYFHINFPPAVYYDYVMKIEPQKYFNFSIPVSSAYCFGLLWPTFKKNNLMIDYQEIIRNIRKRLEFDKVGFILVIIGTVAFYLKSIVSPALNFVIHIIYLFSFSGFLYLFYTNKSTYRTLVLVFILLSVISYTLNSGMFTILAFMGAVISSILLLGSKATFFKKIIIFIFAFFLLYFTQLTKMSFRKKLSTSTIELARGKLILNELKNNLKIVSQLDMDPVYLYPLYLRLNQSYYLQLVMNKIPRQMPFDNGSRLFMTIASSLVPRLFWKDKPKSGGIENMSYYTNMPIKDFTVNVGPVGEAYGSFGPNGAILAIFLLGLFISNVFYLIIKAGTRNGIIILWLPILFMEIFYSFENDHLGIFNSLLKSGLVIFILYRLFPAIFKVNANYKIVKNNFISQKSKF